MKVNSNCKSSLIDIPIHIAAHKTIFAQKMSVFTEVEDNLRQITVVVCLTRGDRVSSLNNAFCRYFLDHLELKYFDQTLPGASQLQT